MDRRATPDPRLRTLELCGQPEQGPFFTKLCGELHANRQAVCGRVQR
jgi:hypothetical protein